MRTNSMIVNVISSSKLLKSLNYTSSRSFYNKYRHGPTAICNPKPDYVEWVKKMFSVEGLKFAKEEAIKVINERKKQGFVAKVRPFNELNIFEHFDSDESIKRWRPVADSSTLNGYSVSRFTRSPQGHGLFSGILDTRLPDDGATMLSGFAGLIGPRRNRTKFFQIVEYWDWSNFNTIEIRYRGDGRKYSVIVNTADYFTDLSFYDAYAYPLYTTGGPYWQTARIPFSKLIFTAKSWIQDEQGWLPVHRVNFIAITLQDIVDGPFSLEIDYIGLINQRSPFNEITAYETYTFPHIKFRQLQTDCDPPDPGAV